jgi:hypothetical protein
MPFSRNCPTCNKEIFHTNIKNRNASDCRKKQCRSCASKTASKNDAAKASWLKIMPNGHRRKVLPPFERKCPNCGQVLTYTTLKGRNRAIRDGKWCKKCRMAEISSRAEVRVCRSVFAKGRIGDKNPFWGKHHTEETKKQVRQADRSYTQTDDFRLKSARHGSQNGMYGKSFYDIWCEKYGVDEANRRLAELSAVRSQQASGENNPMYGKPAPKGSGNGWGGWYKGWYFRSLRELSYMISVIERNHHVWQNAECKEISIPYTDFSGSNRTYHPDFLLDGTVLVEIKPKNLMETPTNRLKVEAAKIYCSDKGWEFRIVDVRILDTAKLIELFLNGEVIFNQKYQKRMEKICNQAKK